MDKTMLYYKKVAGDPVENMKKRYWEYIDPSQSIYRPFRTGKGHMAKTNSHELYYTFNLAHA